MRRTEAPTRDPTDDGRWIVIDGRRWRATDPAIPDATRQAMVDRLMAGRRAVAAARAAGDAEAEGAARRVVHEAKVALGERGESWWEPTPDGRRERLSAVTTTLAGQRGPERTICPSEVARAVGGERWRALMDDARDVARDLARAGRVEVTQRGRALDPDRPWSGPVRIRILGS